MRSCETGGCLQVELAFRLTLTGRPELIQQALQLLPPSTGLDTLDQQGHTALMLSAINNDDVALAVRVLHTCYFCPSLSLSLCVCVCVYVGALWDDVLLASMIGNSYFASL